MKGLMLTLMLTWTGMVVAQQDNSSGFKSSDGTSSGFRVQNEIEPEVVPIESARSSRFGAGGNESVTGQNERAKSAFGGQQRPRDLIDPNRTRASERQFRTNATIVPTPTMYQKLDDNAVSKLVNLGQIEKPIDFTTSRNTQRIRFSDQDQATNASIERIRGRLQDTSLVFEMSTNQLQDMGRKALEFDVPEELRGRYDKLVIEYPPTIAKIQRWNLAGEKDPNRNAMLPIQRREEDRFASAPPRMLENTRDREQDRQLRNQFEMRQAAERERQQLLEKIRHLEADNDTLKQSRLRDQEFENRQRLADSRLLPQTRQQVDLIPRTVTDPQYSALVNELNDLKRQNVETQIDLAKVQGQNDLLAGKLRAVSYEDADSMTQRRNLFNNQNGIVDRGRSVDESAPVAGSVRRSREQNQLNMGGGFDLNENSANNTNEKDVTRKSSNNPTDMMLFILLLMSVALNLYLWWLSRTFHSRYQELADELRETFTATV